MMHITLQSIKQTLNQTNSSALYNMPPKPWLTKTGPPRQDVSAIIQSNPTIKQQIPKISLQQPFTQQQSLSAGVANPLTNTTSNLLGTTTGLGTSAYGSGIGGYGSSYGGGYGSSYGGGYGSSYGGYGGYGGGYSSGLGGYGGGYGSGMGYGRMGMMGGGDPNQKGFVMNTLMTLQSLGFLIGSFCQIGKSLDHNIEGLHLFLNSFTNLFKKIYNAIVNSCCWLSEKVKNSVLGILNFVKTYILFMNHEDPKNKMRSLRKVFNIAVVILIFSMYPQIKKIVSKAG